MLKGEVSQLLYTLWSAVTLIHGPRPSPDEHTQSSGDEIPGWRPCKMGKEGRADRQGGGGGLIVLPDPVTEKLFGV